MKAAVWVGVEVIGFGVGARGLGDGGMKVGLFFLVLDSGAIGLRGCFKSLDRRGDGVDYIC